MFSSILNPSLMNNQFRQYIMDSTNKSINKKVEEYNKKRIDIPLPNTSELVEYDNSISFYRFASFLSITTFVYFLYYRKPKFVFFK